MSDDPEAEIVERSVETSDSDPNYQVLEVIADIEGVDIRDLPPMYQCIDHMLDELYSDPPADEAQVEVTFSYNGYRVTASQYGTIRLRKLGETKTDED
jgi:hypothetical protein